MSSGPRRAASGRLGHEGAVRLGEYDVLTLRLGQSAPHGVDVALVRLTPPARAAAAIRLPRFTPGKRQTRVALPHRGPWRATAQRLVIPAVTRGANLAANFSPGEVSGVHVAVAGASPNRTRDRCHVARVDALGRQALDVRRNDSALDRA
jgi:hypothetical protein